MDDGGQKLEEEADSEGRRNVGGTRWGKGRETTTDDVATSLFGIAVDGRDIQPMAPDSPETYLPYIRQVIACDWDLREREDYLVEPQIDRPPETLRDTHNDAESHLMAVFPMRKGEVIMQHDDDTCNQSLITVDTVVLKVELKDKNPQKKRRSEPIIWGSRISIAAGLLRASTQVVVHDTHEDAGAVKYGVRYGRNTAVYGRKFCDIYQKIQFGSRIFPVSDVKIVR
ncbi:hypothetical protein C8R47DRAFT_1303536 [Mycena vitilis]|nr:hypothetical protein C8R47DRAFT_1303536 [Mycena vitilis]